MNRHGLRDDQFVRIEQLLPGRPGYVGRNSDQGNRLFVEAVIWRFRTGVPWRDIPARFGAWKNIHTRFSRWAKKGVWESLFKALADDLRIPTKPAMHSNRKPATDSDLKPAGIPI
jgi:transposase